MTDTLRVVPALPSDREALESLVQLYAYDFSEFERIDVDERGRFAVDLLRGCFVEPWRHPFVIRVDRKLAGFAIVDERSRLGGDEGVRDVAQFFVLRKWRRQGVGERAATWCFDRFPGAWEVRQTSANVAATRFWTRVVDRYTGGRFESVVWDDERWRGPVQRFRNG